MNINKSYHDKRVSCPICNNTDTEVLFQQKFMPIEDTSILKNYDVSICNQCSMVFANNIPSQGEFDDYYASFSKYEYENPNADPGGFYSFIADIVCELAEKEQSIADIGCGSGNLLFELERRGYKHLVAADLSSHNIERLNKSGNINGIRSSIFDLETDAVDCVLSLSVLEHIVDLADAFRILSKLVKPSGLMLAVVPDMDSFHLDAVRPYRQFSVEHINYFNLESLKTAVALFGFYFERQWVSPGTIIAAFRKLPCESKMHKYLSLCGSALSPIKEKITALSEIGPIIIWGCGTFTQFLLAHTQLSSCNIIGFVDSNTNYHGKKLCGLEITAPEKLNALLESKNAKDASIVLITYYNNDEIEAVIRNKLLLPNKIEKLIMP